MATLEDTNDFIDYYQLLQVTPDTPTKDILKSYRKIALRMHPDKNPDDPNADEKFAVIVEAKEILTSNEKSRKEYDVEYQQYYKKKRIWEEQQKKWQAMDANIQQMKMDLDRKESEYMMNNIYMTSAAAAAAAAAASRHNVTVNHHRIKKETIKQELSKFREQINRLKKQNLEQRKSQKLNDLISSSSSSTSQDNRGDETNIEKDSNKALVLVRWHEFEKAYTAKELKTIFEIYGRIKDLELFVDKHSALILFESIKAAEKACVAKDLEEFGLKASFAGEKMHRERVKQLQRWSKIRPKDINFSQYHDYTKNRVFSQLSSSSNKIITIE